MTLDAWRQRYERLGLATIPLWPGSKQPVCANWQAAPPPVQWHEAGTTAGNIGLRTGNGFAVADADAPQTLDALYRALNGLGIKPPAVATPSGGAHFYLLIADVPSGMAYCHWRGDVGPGELRSGLGAQVAAPCSAVNGKRYRFLPGTAPEDLLNIRPLRWRDVQALIRPKLAQSIDALPVPFPHRELADWATWLLGVLATMPREGRVARMQFTLQGAPRRDSDGNPLVTWYTSRSDAEQSVVLHAVLCGWDFAEVAALFEQYHPGHYAAQRDKERYLHTCWHNALGWLVNTPARDTIAKLWQWAESRPWPGRGGGNEFLAYRALLQRAWLADTMQPDVSRRDVELFASMGNTGARGALRRLVTQGLISPQGQRQRPTAARTWRLEPDVASPQLLDATPPARDVDALPGDAELWAMLGRAAGMVYARLNTEAQTIKTLATETGKHRNTASNALHRLARYGLAIDTGAGWIVGERDAAEVAHEVGASAAKDRRERIITNERITFRETLASRHA